jgi:hypothetical protein
MKIKSRLKIGLGASVLGAIALVAGLVVPAATATANGSVVPSYAMAWKPGTPLPAAAPGTVWMAEPPGSQMKKLMKVGDKIPLVPPSEGVPNSAGYVNLIEDQTYGPDHAHCPVTVLKNLGNKWTNIGSTYLLHSGLWAQFTWLYGQSSSLGVGFSTSGKYGTFTAYGSNSQTALARSGFKGMRGPDIRLYQTEFYFVELGDPPIYHCTQHYIESAYWFGGSWYHNLKSKAPVANTCAPQRAGTSETINTGKAHDYEFGYSVPVLGFGGSSQTGWDNSAEIKYVWGGVNGAICGDGRTPLTSPIVEAKGS